MERTLKDLWVCQVPAKEFLVWVPIWNGTSGLVKAMGQLVSDEVSCIGEFLHTLNAYAALHHSMSAKRDQVQETGLGETKLVCTDQLRDAAQQYNPCLVVAAHTGGAQYDSQSSGQWTRQGYAQPLAWTQSVH